MGYSPWHHKEWDTTEQLTLTLLYTVTVWVCPFELGEGLGGWNLFPTNNKWGGTEERLCVQWASYCSVSPHTSWSKTNEEIYGRDEYIPKSPAEPLLKQICPNSPTEAHVIKGCCGKPLRLGMVCYSNSVCVHAQSLSCVRLCDPPGSSLHEISQARILQWVAIFFSRGSSQPRYWTYICCVFCDSNGRLIQWSSPLNLNTVPFLYTLYILIGEYYTTISSLSRKKALWLSRLDLLGTETKNKV